MGYNDFFFKMSETILHYNKQQVTNSSQRLKYYKKSNINQFTF
jgi:hypothetical protein